MKPNVSRHTALLALCLIVASGLLSACGPSAEDKAWAALNSPVMRGGKDPQPYYDFAKKYPKSPNADAAKNYGIELEIAQTKAIYEKP
ncbi:MAG: hypothetical protein PSV13_10335 [Lacunisphaera sp.]|nr:hypothetical protein [Lacunisphaera sp.]